MKKLGKLVIIIVVSVAVLTVGGIMGFILLTRAPAAAAEKTGPLYETDEFTVNAANSYNHYIKAQFALEMSSEKLKEELTEKKPILKDAIIMVLSVQPIDTLNTQKGKEDLKNSLREAINSFLTKGQVTRIYIESIIFS